MLHREFLFASVCCRLGRALCVLVGFGAVTAAFANTHEVRSPDGQLVVSVALASRESGSALEYAVTYQGRQVIEPSQLGIESGHADWTREIVWEDVATRTHDETWQTVYGERRDVPDRYREAVIRIRKTTGRKVALEVVVRAYDRAAALQYRFPERRDGGDNLHITAERTQFVLPAGTQGWFTPHAQAVSQRRPIPEFAGTCERPLIVELPNGLKVGLAEAAVVDYARMQFVRDETNPNAVRCQLDGAVDEITPFATPWRVILVAGTPGELIEHNYLLLNLNPPNAIADPSWIRPGKAVREMTLSTAGGKAAVDFAAARGLQYILLDAGWYGYEFSAAADATRVDVDPRRNPRNDLDLPAVIAYAREKQIGVWLYVNQRALTAQLDQILPLYRQWGVQGVKFGFVHVGSHRWTTWLHEAVRKAAAHRLMVDIHDEYRPTGFSRTYPNLLTQEGIHGNEEFPDATHNVTLPFTRFTAGAADYTLCYYRQDFGDGRTGKFIKTTSAHQLSMAVVYYSPLQVMFWYDRPGDYRGEPELEFWKVVPTTWDETRVVHGEIGQFITVARRKGEDWFVGTMTNNDGRVLEVPLSFLPAGRSYRATIYADDPGAPTRTKVGIREQTVNAATVLTTPLRPSGGQAVWLRPQS